MNALQDLQKLAIKSLTNGKARTSAMQSRTALGVSASTAHMRTIGKPASRADSGADSVVCEGGGAEGSGLRAGGE